MTPAERVVRHRIEADGPLPFAEFMRIALYDPEVGYYGRLASPLGVDGDYYTSPELHPAFAVLLGRQLLQLWQGIDRPEPFVVHEAGPGSGIFARDVLNWARAAQTDLYAAIRYRLEELSPALIGQQHSRLELARHGARVSWVRGVPARGAHCVLANELLDALPVHLVENRGGHLQELYVVSHHDQVELEPGPLSRPELAAYFDRLGLLPGEGCRAEVNLAALDWMRAAARGVKRGLLLALDYGYPAERLYDPARTGGSLLCYYRHSLSSDPLIRIGRQDMTSHVDFTSLRLAGEQAGLTTLCLVSQRKLLINLGWDLLRRGVATAELGQAERDENLRALDALVDGDGLGRILALVQQRGLDGFAPIGLVGTGQPFPDGQPLRGPEHLRLPDLSEAEGLPDFESQWAEFWSGTETP